MLVGDLIDFHASGEGSRGHEILHNATVLELVLNGVGMVLSSVLKVVRGWQLPASTTTLNTKELTACL
jgi:hypothetical protein